MQADFLAKACRMGWAAMLWYSAIGCGRLLASTPVAASAAALECSIGELRLGNNLVRFDPRAAADLQRLGREVAAVLSREESGHSRADSFPDKHQRRGLQEIQRLREEMGACAQPGQRCELVRALLETVAAVNNSQRSPVPERIDGLETPFVFCERLNRPVGRGRTPATNLQPGAAEDLSRVDPLPSTFWRRPADIPAQDLYSGFGRTRVWSLEDKLCSYAGPKESAGLNPGCEVECDGAKVKLKFGEVSSEPFGARIFAALGYHVDPTDFAPAVNLRYDRRLFREFHSRKPVQTRFTLFRVVPVYTLELQKRFDPFDYIAWAVLRDGRHWSGHELKKQLFRDPAREHPEDDAANFRPEIEADIVRLVTVPANVQVRDPHLKSIGPWDFGQLDHASRRELRGAGLLAAWLGWFDTRFDNTRLRLETRDGRRQLLHYFSDLGGVLGETSGLLYERGELPNAFPWTFTRPPLEQGPHRLGLPLRLDGYKPVARVPAFAAMTIDDARWMARLIARLTESQIVQALVAAGFDSAEVRLYTEKLLSRRDQMILDLGLSREFPPCRPVGVSRRFSYNPASDGPVSVQVPGVGEVRAPVTNLQVVEGRLVGAK